MVVYRQRRSNTLGWLVFFAIGAVVFAALVGAGMVLKDKLDEREKAGNEEGAKKLAKQLDPKVQIGNYLKADYKKKGLAHDLLTLNGPFPVESKTTQRKFQVARITHRATGGESSDNPVIDQIIMIETMGNNVKIEVMPWSEWEKKKEEQGLETGPDQDLGGPPTER